MLINVLQRSAFIASKNAGNYLQIDSDNHAGKLKLVEAPRAHEMTRRYLHDCEYAKISQIRAGVVEAVKL